MGDTIIYSYPWQQAVEDGNLTEVFKDRWISLTKGKPILASIGVYKYISLAGIQEIWNEFVAWRVNVEFTLPPEDRQFETVMNKEKVWVCDSGTHFTILFPSEY